MKTPAHLLYKTDTLYLFPMQPDLLFWWEMYLICRILPLTGSLHPGTVQWLRGLCIVSKDYVRL